MLLTHRRHRCLLFLLFFFLFLFVLEPCFPPIKRKHQSSAQMNFITFSFDFMSVLNASSTMRIHHPNMNQIRTDRKGEKESDMTSNALIQLTIDYNYLTAPVKSIICNIHNAFHRMQFHGITFCLRATKRIYSITNWLEFGIVNAIHTHQCQLNNNFTSHRFDKSAIVRYCQLIRPHQATHFNGVLLQVSRAFINRQLICIITTFAMQLAILNGCDRKKRVEIHTYN